MMFVITISDDYIFVFFVFLAVSINKAGLQINTRRPEAWMSIKIQRIQVRDTFYFFYSDYFFSISLDGRMK
jgi:hypothetical protein